MTHGLHGAETAALEAYTGLEDTQRASFMLGRLLQALPDTPIDVHMQHVTEAMDVLKPQGGITLGDKHLSGVFGFSQAVQDRYGRPHVLLETVDRTGHVVFYRSNSHAVWRAELGSGFKGYIAKGMFGAESSTDAPLDLQKFLARLADKERAEGVALTDILYAIHTDEVDLPEPVVNRVAEGKMHAAGIAPKPRYAGGDILSDDPDELFVQPKTPQLDSPLDEWTSTPPMYGVVTSTVYPSADATIHYLVNAADYAGQMQRWIGAAQVVGARITRLALPQEFVQIPEELLKPPIDYGANDRYAERRQSMSRFEQFVLEAGLSS
jgi:hypothetical protein